MNSRSATRIDEHVGNRMRMRRIMMGISQEKLGEQLGVTFQQIQKYERATNRVSASRLFEIARILEVSVSFFFEDLEAGSPDGMSEAGGDYVTDILTSSEGLRLNRAFAGIESPAVRKKLVELAAAIAQQESGEEES